MNKEKSGRGHEKLMYNLVILAGGSGAFVGDLLESAVKK
jgi:hypothetical protein